MSSSNALKQIPLYSTLMSRNHHEVFLCRKRSGHSSCPSYGTVSPFHLLPPMLLYCLLVSNPNLNYHLLNWINLRSLSQHPWKDQFRTVEHYVLQIFESTVVFRIVRSSSNSRILEHVTWGDFCPRILFISIL